MKHVIIDLGYYAITAGADERALRPSEFVHRRYKNIVELIAGRGKMPEG